MSKRRANGEGSLRKRKDGRWEGRYTAGTDLVTEEERRDIEKNAQDYVSHAKTQLPCIKK